MSYDTPTSSSVYGQPAGYGQQSDNGGVREQARNVGSQAAQAGSDVAQTAKQQGREVAGEATRQARNLYGEARDQLASQTSDQQRRAAGGLRSLADEMRAMAEQGGQSGPVSELARQAADRVHGVAGWLEAREPGDIVNEVRHYARRNPGTFLAGAALLGVLAGRLTRNLASASDGQPTMSGTGRAFASDDTVPISDPDRTAVLPPTPAPRPAADPYAAPATGYAEPGTPTGYAQPLPPAGQTDPLPGVPSSGVRP
ncbi:MAG TPA: hypothetical protein VF462_14065 [Micromonosporaceae bacterium]